MRETAQARRLLARPAVSRIRVDGRLPPRWSGRLGGMTIAIWEEPGQPTITELTGPLPDQAARLGVRNQRSLHRVPTPARGVSCRVRRRRMPLPSAGGGVPTRDATCC